MNNEYIVVLEKYLADNFIKIIFSGQKADIKKVVIRNVLIKHNEMCQVEKFVGAQVFHENIERHSLLEYIVNNFSNAFRQINIVKKQVEITIIISKNGKIHVAERNTVSRPINLSHNKQKRYLLCEGCDIPPLRDLGIFAEDNTIIKSKFDKYKQINHFIEIIDHEIKHYNKDSISILDFGCGKSYLTFVVYYYFAFVKNIDVKVVGYDIKSDVVENCNMIAKKYGYENLKFINQNVENIHFNQSVDMMISLHACDTATDYALEFAIKNNIKYVFTVPCCQHEINNQISSRACDKVLLRHGIIKERYSSLLTDAIRCDILQNMGYDVDVLEFVDFSHSPKNLLIRAVKRKEQSQPSANSEELLKSLSSHQKLYELIYGKLTK